MLDLPEPLGRRRADALRRRVGRHELRVCRLELDELVVVAVVGRVVDDRIVDDVVGVAPLRQELAQLVDAPLDGLRRPRGRQ